MTSICFGADGWEGVREQATFGVLGNVPSAIWGRFTRFANGIARSHRGEVPCTSISHERARISRLLPCGPTFCQKKKETAGLDQHRATATETGGMEVRVLGGAGDDAWLRLLSAKSKPSTFDHIPVNGRTRTERAKSKFSGLATCAHEERQHAACSSGRCDKLIGWQIAAAQHVSDRV